MYTFERAFEENPSFSSTLLDKIYRSIDEYDNNTQKDLKFYRGEAEMQRKPSKGAGRSGRKGEEEVSSLKRVSLVEKWMEKKEIEERNKLFGAIETKSRRDQDALFLSSTSSSSDSDSGSFSPSETESNYGTMSNRSCFSPLKSKPLVKSGKPLKTKRTLFHDFHHYNSVSEKSPKIR